MITHTTFDPVTLTVIDNYLTTTCRDMGVTMMTTAYSPIFNESLDFSCVIFDPAGQMIAQAEFCPSQIGTIKFTVDWTLEELGLDVFEPGDVLLHERPLSRLRSRPRAHDAQSRSSIKARSSPSSPTSRTCPNRGPRRQAVFAATPPRSSRRGCCSRR